MEMQEYLKRYKQEVKITPTPNNDLRYHCAFGSYAVPDTIIEQTLWVRDLHPFSVGVAELEGPNPTKRQNRPFFDWLLSVVQSDGWAVESADDLQGFLMEAT